MFARRSFLKGLAALLALPLVKQAVPFLPAPVQQFAPFVPEIEHPAAAYETAALRWGMTIDVYNVAAPVAKAHLLRGPDDPIERHRRS